MLPFVKWSRTDILLPTRINRKRIPLGFYNNRPGISSSHFLVHRFDHKKSSCTSQMAVSCGWEAQIPFRKSDVDVLDTHLVHLQKAITMIRVATMPAYLIHLSTRWRLSISFSTELESPTVLRMSSALRCTFWTSKQKERLVSYSTNTNAVFVPRMQIAI